MIMYDHIMRDESCIENAVLNPIFTHLQGQK